MGKKELTSRKNAYRREAVNQITLAISEGGSYVANTSSGFVANALRNRGLFVEQVGFGAAVNRLAEKADGVLIGGYGTLFWVCTPEANMRYKLTAAKSDSVLNDLYRGCEFSSLITMVFTSSKDNSGVVCCLFVSNYPPHKVVGDIRV